MYIMDFGQMRQDNQMNAQLMTFKTQDILMKD